MRTDVFDYKLPPNLIAQAPHERGTSRLLVLHRSTGSIDHRTFSDLPSYLLPSDLLIVNDTRVSARRLRAQRENGHQSEVLLIRPIGEKSWECLVRPARPARPGVRLNLMGRNGASLPAIVVGETAEGGRLIELHGRLERDSIALWGETPVPPYIRTPLPIEQEERYQTVYGTHIGSAAAPTAGLHFTPHMLQVLAAKGIQTAPVTLSVGVGTFRPVRSETVETHVMHSEWAELSEETARQINQHHGRIVAVGTTTVRTLETAAVIDCDTSTGTVRVIPFSGQTDIFITPGFRFRAVDALLTNFHLPKSTLLMLVRIFFCR